MRRRADWNVIAFLGCFYLLNALHTQLVYSQPTRARIDSALASTRWESMWDIRPKAYVAPKISSPIVIDGNLDDRAWSYAEWSTDFVDIEGPIRPDPSLQTRVKMAWDGEYLYIGAELEEPHVWATLTEKNSVIFHDDDFEVFIDPNADNHNYYELELNAFDTRWELRLVRPYRDGGPVLSGENMDGLVSAITVTGTINDPRDRDKGWSVELAIPWEGLRSYDAVHLPPEPGGLWRINFSRVDHAVEVVAGSYAKVPGSTSNNWVWSAQGIVDMHAPERWGIVHFYNHDPIQQEIQEQTKHARDALMEIYYRQKAYWSVLKTFAADLSLLQIDRGHLPSGSSVIASDTTFDASFYLDLTDDLRIEFEIDETGQIRQSIR